MEEKSLLTKSDTICIQATKTKKTLTMQIPSDIERVKKNPGTEKTRIQLKFAENFFLKF